MGTHKPLSLQYHILIDMLFVDLIIRPDFRAHSYFGFPPIETFLKTEEVIYHLFI